MILSSLIAQLVSASFLLCLARGFVLPISTSSLVPPTTPLLPEATGISTPARNTIATSTSISTSTSYTPTPLYLHVTPSSPDILGISNISGVYGPGAWGAWFLTGVAAWYRIFTQSEEKIDVNTWVFLLGINWSAMDVFRITHRMRTCSALENETEFKALLGWFGAAFTVLFWGSFHAILQVPVTAMAFAYEDVLRLRMRILIGGLIMPFIGLLASASLLYKLPDDNSAFQLLPALYYRGMDSTLHGFLFVGGAFGPALLFPLIIECFWAIYRGLDPWDVMSGLDVFGDAMDAMEKSNSKMLKYLTAAFAIASLISFIAFIILLCLKNEAGLFLMLPFLVLMSFMFPSLPVSFWVSVPLIGPGCYIWDGYFHRKSEAWVSESCFFMPCSPQSISDDDQMYALLAGIFLFLGLEIVPKVFKRVRRWYRDNIFLVQMVEGALAMRRERTD
jgi:hypothetical protein